MLGILMNASPLGRKSWYYRWMRTNVALTFFYRERTQVRDYHFRYFAFFL